MSQRRSNRQPARGVGISKSGYQLPPVALPGLTNQERLRLKATSSGAITKYKGNQSLKNRLNSSSGKAVPGRSFSQEALWQASSVSQQLLNQQLLSQQQQQGPGEGWDPTDVIASVVSAGASFINPLLGAVAGPVVGLISGAIKSGQEKERQEILKSAETGCDTLKPREGYNPYANIDGRATYEDIQYGKYLKCLEAKKELDKDAAAAKCQKVEVTPDMLEYVDRDGNPVTQTIEEFMKDRNIAPAQG
jgi:hypothetical protein